MPSSVNPGFEVSNTMMYRVFGSESGKLRDELVQDRSKPLIENVVKKLAMGGK